VHIRLNVGQHIQEVYLPNLISNVLLVYQVKPKLSVSCERECPFWFNIITFLKTHQYHHSSRRCFYILLAHLKHTIIVSKVIHRSSFTNTCTRLSFRIRKMLKTDCTLPSSRPENVASRSWIFVSTGGIVSGGSVRDIGTRS
jgi:hypothetical protein